LLVLVAHLFQAGQITSSEKSYLKDMAFSNNEKVFSAIEDYLIYRDIAVWHDLCRHCIGHVQDPWAGDNGSDNYNKNSDGQCWLWPYLLDSSWQHVLKSEFTKSYFLNLASYVQSEVETRTVYPPPALMFNALNMCPFEKLKVVVLGQDPYHGPGQAHGLSFSVPHGVPMPPSLKNIFKELQDDLNILLPDNGNLERWAQQGVLLLNTLLSVREHEPMSHANKGWEIFTDTIIDIINKQKSGVVFILWGGAAQKRGLKINTSTHLVLQGAHPSPLSARVFFGCKHFSQCNKYLLSMGKKEINW